MKEIICPSLHLWFSLRAEVIGTLFPTLIGPLSLPIRSGKLLSFCIFFAQSWHFFYPNKNIYLLYMKCFCFLSHSIHSHTSPWVDFIHIILPYFSITFTVLHAVTFSFKLSMWVNSKGVNKLVDLGFWVSLTLVQKE